jgi:citrate synthase
MATDGTAEGVLSLVRNSGENRRNKLVVAGQDVGELMRDALAGKVHFERVLMKVALDLELTEAQERLAGALLIACAYDLRSKADVELVMLTTSTGVPLLEAIRPALPLLREGEQAARLLVDCDAAGGNRMECDATIRRTMDQYGFLPGFDDGSEELVSNASLGKRILEVFPGGRFARILAELGTRGYHAGVDAVCAAFLLELGAPAAVCSSFRFMGRIPVYSRVHRGERRQRPNRFIGLVENGGEIAETDSASGEVRELLESGSRYFHLFFRMVFDRMPSDLEYRVFTGLTCAAADSTDKTAASATVRLLSSQGLTFTETFQGYLSNFGIYHMGAIPHSLAFLREAGQNEERLDAFLEGHLDRKRVPGFGHRFHRRDPRAEFLTLCEEAGFTGPYIRVARALDAKRFEVPWLHLNVDGMVAAILLTLGIDPAVADTPAAVVRTPRMVKDFLTGSSKRGRYEGLKRRSGLL